LADDWRLLLRGEAGYSEAATQDLSLELEEGTVGVSLTELPFQYRFRAGGSFSVRGYDFESLSNNGIGSNHILTASTELEYRFREQWSAVAFVDTGNAFNDWGDPSLRTGWGLGVRWYTIAFPLRLDFAQALDLDGEPWQIHFTIGSPLF
jgi:translocation and assembly module TamA